MELRSLGGTDLSVSVVGLGCNNFGWQIDAGTTANVVAAALDAGVTLFDTADVYGKKGLSEEFLGKALGARRQNVVLASKFGLPMDGGQRRGASRRYIVSAVEDSLRRLGTEWIDLYQLHRPDPLTPIEETLGALDVLCRDGKVRYVGCSELPAWELADAQWTARSSSLRSFVSAQYEYSLLARGVERELIPAMQHYGVSLLPYFPLASGMLTGKYRRNDVPADGRLARDFREQFLTERNWSIIERLECFARDHAVSMVAIAFGWLLAKSPVASVIAGATRVEQVLQNVAAGAWRPSAQELAAIDALSSS